MLLVALPMLLLVAPLPPLPLLCWLVLTVNVVEDVVPSSVRWN